MIKGVQFIDLNFELLIKRDIALSALIFLTLKSKICHMLKIPLPVFISIQYILEVISIRLFIMLIIL